MTDSAKSREDIIKNFSNKVFSAMLQDILMDTILQSHKDAVRTLFHMNATLEGSSPSVTKATNGPAALGMTSANTPATIKDKTDGNIYFECTNCQKKIASNRYAPHLSSCLGIGTGSRRGATRHASARNRLGSELERGASPALSDYGSPLLDTPNSKGKAKLKGSSKKSKGKALDGESNGNHKRPSGEMSPSKKAKKQKTGDSSVSLDLMAKAGSMPAPTSTSPPVPPSPSGASGSQYSVKDSPGASTSPLNALSPNALARSSHIFYTPPSNTNVPPKKHGPPIGAPRTHIPRVEDREEDTVFIGDVDGEEQEESTTDSSE